MNTVAIGLRTRSMVMGCTLGQMETNMKVTGLMISSMDMENSCGTLASSTLDNSRKIEGTIARQLFHGPMEIGLQKEKKGKMISLETQLFLARYQGGFIDNLIEGVGTYQHSSGDTYIGEWKASQRHGRANYIYQYGGRFDGYFLDDERNGQGGILTCCCAWKKHSLVVQQVYSSGQMETNLRVFGKKVEELVKVDSLLRKGLSIIRSGRNPRTQTMQRTSPPSFQSTKNRRRWILASNILTLLPFIFFVQLCKHKSPVYVKKSTTPSFYFTQINPSITAAAQQATRKGPHCFFFFCSKLIFQPTAVSAELFWQQAVQPSAGFSALGIGKIGRRL